MNLNQFLYYFNKEVLKIKKKILKQLKVKKV